MPPRPTSKTTSVLAQGQNEVMLSRMTGVTATSRPMVLMAVMVASRYQFRMDWMLELGRFTLFLRQGLHRRGAILYRTFRVSPGSVFRIPVITHIDNGLRGLTISCEHPRYGLAGPSASCHFGPSCPIFPPYQPTEPPIQNQGTSMAYDPANDRTPLAEVLGNATRPSRPPTAAKSPSTTSWTCSPILPATGCTWGIRGLYGDRHRLPLQTDERLQCAAPHGLGSFGLPAENHAMKTGTHPAVTTTQEHRQLQTAAEDARLQLRLGPRGRHQ